MRVQPKQTFCGITLPPNCGAVQKGDFGQMVVDCGLDTADQFPCFRQADSVVDPVLLRTFLRRTCDSPAKAQREVILGGQTADEREDLLRVQYRNQRLNVRHSEWKICCSGHHGQEIQGASCEPRQRKYSRSAESWPKCPAARACDERVHRTKIGTGYGACPKPFLLSPPFQPHCFPP